MEVKIGIFGGSDCGILQISLAYLNGEFSEGYIPSIEDSFTKVTEIDGKSIKLSIIDVAGQDFAELRFSYYAQIQAMILVFDISDPSSIEEIRSIYKDAIDTNDEIIFAIAANKGYLRDENKPNLVPIEEYKKIEEEFKCKVFETNYKSISSINEIFDYLLRQVIRIEEQKGVKENFPKDQKKNGQFVLRNNINSSEILQQKRSSSYFMNKSKLTKAESKETANINQPKPSPEYFSSPMGAEIKTILQSRTKQLQLVTEEKKELEKKLKQKELELEKALEKIQELEKKESDTKIRSKKIQIFSPQEIEQLKKVKEIGKDASNEVLKVSRKQVMTMVIFNFGIMENYIFSEEDPSPPKKERKRRSDLDDDDKKKLHKKRKSDLSDSNEPIQNDQEKRSKSDLDETTEPVQEEPCEKQKRIERKRATSILPIKKIEETSEKVQNENKKIERRRSSSILPTHDMILTDRDKLARILQLYETLNILDHPNIVKALGICFGDEHHNPSILLEFFTNNLTKIVKKLTNEEKITIIYEICIALKEAHFLEVAHLHLNPDNIQIDAEKHVKISDFGFSSLINFDSPKFIINKYPSTYQFFAPELFQWTKINSEKVDVYSFGVVLYYILSNGECPKIDGFKDSEVKIDTSVFPESINNFSKKLICKCCSNNPDDRYSFAEIIDSIQTDFGLIDGVDISLIRSRLQLD